MKLQMKSYAIRKIMIAASFKIVLNYSQTITIIKKLDLNWSEYLADLFQVYHLGSGNLQQIVSIECLFDSKLYCFMLNLNEIS